MRSARAFLVQSALVTTVAFAITAPTFAVINPYTETFSGPAANWAVASTGPGAAPLTYLPSGGPDGSGYGSGSFGFASAGVGSFPILFRSQSSFGSSGGAFLGNWITAGVSTFSVSVRHNAPVNLDFFARFSAGATPGVVYQEPVAIAANTWTTITVPIATSTAFIYEGAPSLFASTFTSVDRVQVGIVAGPSIAGQAGPFVFDIDNVSIVPAPAAGSLLFSAGLLAARRRRSTSAQFR